MRESRNLETGSERTAISEAVSTKRQHVLMTVLGMSRESACYCLQDRKVDSILAPVALYKLLEKSEQPDLVVALCTAEAEEANWPLLQTELDGLCKTKLVRVPAGETGEEINGYMVEAAKAIPDNVEITVDVTHGFRHFSFITYMVTLYVSALHDVRVKGAWYGLLRRNEPSPFLDLRPLLELPRWFYALQSFIDTGSAQQMAVILNGGKQSHSEKRIAEDLEKISDTYLSGLPLELGRQACIVRKDHAKPLRRLFSNSYHLPLGHELANHVEKFLYPYELAVSGDGWKGRVQLTRCELKRQADYIDDLLNHRHTATALGLMSEWTVSWVLWTKGQTGDWLNYNNSRRGAANLLGVIERVAGDQSFEERLAQEQFQLGRYWGKLREIRNGYAHHGMRPGPLVGDKKTEKILVEVKTYWQNTLRCCPCMNLSLGEQPERPLLISPIGMRPGVLFSALQACRSETGEPALLIVICSHGTRSSIECATNAAGYSGRIEPILLDDPYGGVTEIKRKAHDIRAHFIGVGKTLVNITGGTTLMGLLAEELANTARDLACPVQRFGLIDRRPPTQQEADPWQAGEPFWIDREDSGNADED